MPLFVFTAPLLILPICLNFLLTPSPVHAKPEDRFVVSLLGEDPVVGPSQLLTVMDWRLRALRHMQIGSTVPANASRNATGLRLNRAFYTRPVYLLGVELGVKCTDFDSGRPLDKHCPSLHYLVKYVAMRIIFLTLGSLAAAIGTCDLGFARKFQEQRGTVLRQIPLSRRNTVMQGFDLLRHRNQPFDGDFGDTGSLSGPGLQLFDVKDGGRREELLRQGNVSD